MTLKYINYVLVLLLPFFVVTIFVSDDYLFQSFLLSIFNTLFIIKILTFNKFQNKFHVIFLIYFLITLTLPFIYLYIVYDFNNINIYFRYRNITDIHVFYSNLIITLFLILFFFFSFLFSALIKKSDYQIYKKVIFNNNKTPIVLLFLIISYSMKFYLIKTGIWFSYIDVDLRKFPFAGIATLLEKLDLLILFYYSFLHYKKKLTKFNIIIIIITLSISVSFALISTSKEKVLVLFIPIIVMMINSNRKSFATIFFIFLLYFMNTFFDYMKLLRYSQNSIGSTAQSLLQDKGKLKRSVFDDSLFFRLDYQTILAVVIKKQFLFPTNYKFNYSDNIIGLIPRLIWPTKPNIGLDMNQVGRELNIINKFDKSTSIGITPLGVAYYQLGLIGIIFISIFISFIITLCTKKINGNTWIGYLIGFIIAITLARNGTYTNIIPGLLKIFIIFYIAALLLSSKEVNEN